MVIYMWYIKLFIVINYNTLLNYGVPDQYFIKLMNNKFRIKNETESIIIFKIMSDFRYIKY